jgi:hypothetical protein
MLANKHLHESSQTYLAIVAEGLVAGDAGLGLADGAGTRLSKLCGLNLALATLHLHSQSVCAKKK